MNTFIYMTIIFGLTVIIIVLTRALIREKAKNIIDPKLEREFIKSLSDETVKKTAYLDGIDEGRKQMITASKEIPFEQQLELQKFLVERKLILCYDPVIGGFRVRKMEYYLDNSKQPAVIQEPYQDDGPIIKPIKISARLKKTQYNANDGSWTFKYKGEVKSASLPDIDFYTKELVDGLKLIDLEEIENLRIA